MKRFRLLLIMSLVNLISLPTALFAVSPNLDTIKAQLLDLGFEESPVRTIAEFKDLTVDGKGFKLADTKDKVFIFNYWATWCGPCVAEMPSIERLWQRYKDKPNFKILACSNEIESTVKKFVNAKKFTFPIAYASRSFDSYGFRYIPTTLVVAPSGQVIAQMVGSTEWDSPDLYKIIDQLLALPTSTVQDSPEAVVPEFLSDSTNPPLNAGVEDLDFMSDLEYAVLLELNAVRLDPKAYAEKLRAYRRLFQGNNIVQPGKITIRTNEGIRAVDEAIRVLESTSPMPALMISRGMSKAAKDHVNDTGPRGTTGHTSSDGSDPFKRMNRYGTWQTTAGENISYGYNTAEEILIQLLVDDGVSSRGHRKNILNKDFKVVGIACGTHRSYEFMCVHDYAGAYQEK